MCQNQLSPHDKVSLEKCVIHKHEKRISELERYYIKKYDSYLNGYNQNEGGNFGPSNGGTHLTKNDIFDICSALEFCSRPGAVLSEIFNVTTTTISRIKKKNFEETRHKRGFRIASRHLKEI